MKHHKTDMIYLYKTMVLNCVPWLEACCSRLENVKGRFVKRGAQITYQDAPHCIIARDLFMRGLFRKKI